MAKFIAEICSNHNGSLERALQLIDVAAEAGCWGVKFQLFRIDRMFHHSILRHPDYAEMLRAREAWEMPIAWLPKIADRCRKRKVKFICTPFYLDAVMILDEYVDCLKIASYEAPWKALVEAVARTGKPTFISAGLVRDDELSTIVKAWEGAQGNIHKLTFFHCVSRYPASPSKAAFQAGFSRIKALGGHRIGYSDHTCSPGVILAAILRYQADYIEFHLDLDGLGWEYEMDHCWLPHQIAKVIRLAGEGLAADNGEVVNEAEIEFRRDQDGFRPLVATRGRLRGI